MNKTKNITQEGWQPIETAPKDGTAVLLCWAINADGKPIDWTADPTTSGVFVQVASWWGGEDEWVVYCSMVRDPSLHFNPTHWMPIPPPPTQEGGGMNENGTGVPGTEAPRYYCNKCGATPHVPRHQRPDGKPCDYLAVFVPSVVKVCRAEQRGASEWVCDCAAPGPNCKPTGWRAPGAPEVERCQKHGILLCGWCKPDGEEGRKP